MITFKEWLLERITDPLPYGDVTKNQDLRGGMDSCETQPIGVRTMCQSPTSAMPTFKKPKSRRATV